MASARTSSIVTKKSVIASRARNRLSPDPDSLGETVDLTIGGDGSYDLKVHMHD